MWSEMKLWEIKAQALRIMFADTDMEFSKDEFEEGVVYDNANTREKLIRMNDAINRAIDLYYQYNGDITRRKVLKLFSENGEYKNYLSPLSQDVEDFSHPTRIDVMPNLDKGIRKRENISFDFDAISKEIHFPMFDFQAHGDAIDFLLYYKMKRMDIDSTANEMETDLDTLNIPHEVQRKIPLFIKGELYEEDEYQVAQAAKNEYLQFLIGRQRSTFSKVTTRVRNNKPNR